MNVETVALDTLLLDPSNARKHNQKNLEAIKGSLTKFGQQKPIVVGNDNIVIAGNGTLEAARALGWKEIRIVRTALEGFEATAYAIADNRTGELAEWDTKAIADSLKALEKVKFDVSAIGFDVKDIKKFLKEGETKEDFDDPEVDYANELGPKHHYVVMVTDDENLYERFCEKVGVKKIKYNISASGNKKSGFLRYGRSRVVDIKSVENVL